MLANVAAVKLPGTDNTPSLESVFTTTGCRPIRIAYAVSNFTKLVFPAL
jgi:hypothetical protein